MGGGLDRGVFDDECEIFARLLGALSLLAAPFDEPLRPF